MGYLPSLGSKAVHFVSDITTVLLNPLSDDEHSKPPVKPPFPFSFSYCLLFSFCIFAILLISIEIRALNSPVERFAWSFLEEVAERLLEEWGF